VALAPTLAAQLPGRQAAPGPPPQAADPFGRGTPRGTIEGFTSAVYRGDYGTAAQYMQLTATQRPAAEALARDLRALLDRYYTAPVTALSDLPGGVTEDGLPLDHERVRLALARRTVEALDTWYGTLRWPVTAVLTLVAHAAVTPWLGYALQFRLIYSRFLMVASVLALAWLTWRLLTLTFAQTRLMALRRGQAGTRSVLLLGERVFKVLVVLTAIFSLLSIAGVNTTTALAGVGIGGLAVALGAQKSVENLLGGIFLLTDKALAVGDWCRISGREGRVEDITLRSVRLRTLEQTLLSIPAGTLSQDSVENFSARDKILLQTTLRLSYGTSAAEVQSVLDGIRRLLADHPQVESDSARIRLVNFGPAALELELFAYVLTPDAQAFLAVRESLLLQAATIVEASGSSFARPTELPPYGGPAR
jgi:MscS family membrane protein